MSSRASSWRGMGCPMKRKPVSGLFIVGLGPVTIAHYILFLEDLGDALADVHARPVQWRSGQGLAVPSAFFAASMDLMTRAQRSVSLLMKRAKSSGLPPAALRPWLCNPCKTVGSFNAALVASESLSITGLGRPPGPRMPNQRPAAETGTAASATVGRSAAMFERLASVVASGLTRPSLMSPSTVGAGANITPKRPAT